MLLVNIWKSESILENDGPTDNIISSYGHFHLLDPSSPIEKLFFKVRAAKNGDLFVQEYHHCVYLTYLAEEDNLPTFV